MIIEDKEIKRVLSDSKIIVVVGCSSAEFKVAHRIPKFMQQHGYKIIPVNPFSKNILGEKCYESISQVKEQVDIVQVFRPSKEVFEIVKESLKLKPRIIWMQLGIENKAAEKLAEKHGIKVVMNRCMKVEYERLFSLTTIFK